MHLKVMRKVCNVRYTEVTGGSDQAHNTIPAGRSASMSHAFSVPDEVYATLEAYASRKGKTIKELFQAWLQDMRQQADTAPEEESARTTSENEQEVAAAQAEFFALAGMFTSGAPDLAERHDA